MNMENPVLQWKIECSMVTVLFIREGSLNVKGQIRDILTKAYEERFQNELKRQKKFR